jgi:hypothetical protein
MGKGILIPPIGYHSLAGIVGDRKFLEELRDAIEEALASGVDEVEVFTPDGEDCTVIVKLEENEDKIPLLYADFEAKEENGEVEVETFGGFIPQEWEKARKLLEKEKQILDVWKRIYDNLATLRTFLITKLTEKKDESLGKVLQQMEEREFSLLYDERGHIKLPTMEELREYLDWLWENWKLPDYCLRLLLTGTERELEVCLELSCKLVEKGLPNGLLEGVGFTKRGEFVFLFRDTKKVEIPLEKGWELEEERLIIRLGKEELDETKPRVQVVEISLGNPVGIVEVPAGRIEREIFLFPLRGWCNLMGYLTEVTELLEGKKGTLYLLPHLPNKGNFIKVDFEKADEIPFKLVDAGEEVTFWELPANVRKKIGSLLKVRSEDWEKLPLSQRKIVEKWCSEAE